MVETTGYSKHTWAQKTKVTWKVLNILANNVGMFFEEHDSRYNIKDEGKLFKAVQRYRRIRSDRRSEQSTTRDG